jgi:hypothetical protein
MTAISRTRYRVILSCMLLVLLVAALWSMPLQAQDGFISQQATYRPTLTPLPRPVSLLLTINTSSCLLSVVAPAEVAEVAEEAPARATYRPTLTPIAPAVEETTDEASEPAVDAFDLSNAQTYTIGEGCDAVVERLSIPQNDVRWFSITEEGDDVTFLALQHLPDDPFPPQLDVRGRYFACGIPEGGQQICQLAVMVGEQAYIVQIPVNVGEAYFGPTFVAPELTETVAP